MTWLFLEAPLVLLGVLIAIQFLLVCLWSWRRTPATGRAVWIGFGAIPLLLLLSWLVITPRERLLGICQNIATHAERGEVDFIGRYIVDDVDADGWDHEELLSNIERLLAVYRLQHTSFSGFEVTPDGNEQVAEFQVSCDVSTREGDLQRLPTAWRLTFRGQGKEWMIVRIESIPVFPLNIRDLRDLLRR